MRVWPVAIGALAVRRPAGSAFPGLAGPAGAADRVAEGVRPAAVSPAEGAPGAVRHAAPGRRTRRSVRLPEGRRPTPKPSSDEQVSVCHPTSYRRAGTGRTAAHGVRCCRPAASRTSMDGVRRLGGRSRRPAAADGGSLPAGPPPARCADGRRRAGRRPVELRRRQPAAAAEGQDKAGIGVAEPWWPVEDDIDDEVRADLDRWQADGDVSFIGVDGPRRFPATTAEALAAFQHFLDAPARRLRPVRGRHAGRRPVAGAFADLQLAEPRSARSARPRPTRSRPPTAHGGVPISLGGGLRPADHRLAGLHLEPLLAPRPGLPRAATGSAPTGRSPAGSPNWTPTPSQARCLSSVLAGVRDHAWVHHIPRLMVLGNYAMQRGWQPGAR